MTSAGGLPTAGEWGALLSAPTIPVRELARAQVPGTYLWWHHGQAVYVGMAPSLRDCVPGKRSWTPTGASAVSSSPLDRRRAVWRTTVERLGMFIPLL